ncbi:MAG: hypothetical protein ACYDH0_04610 [Candidatus Aminicenantales bacterium]
MGTIKRNLSSRLQLAIALVWAVQALAGPASARPLPELREYRARILASAPKGKTFEGGMAAILLRIENSGTETWESTGAFPCFVSYHLFDGKGALVRFENPRFPLPRKVPPGRTIEVTAAVKAPLAAGRYFLEFDLLKEGLTWFKDRGSEPFRLPLEVAPREWPEDRVPLSIEPGPYTKTDSSVPEFNSLMKLIRITLKNSEVSFVGRTGGVDGFAAGTGYPQIWLRDANTILPASIYFYPAPFLHSWLDEHLALQKPDGSLWDWVDSKGTTDTNTVASDQETSAVQAAFRVHQILGPSWPKVGMGGSPAVRRLEKALEYLLQNRLDEKHGLIMRAHTADWGDVDPNLADQGALDVDRGTHWTAGIYDQAMFYEAALDLASWHEAAGSKALAVAWKDRAARIRRNADKWLWQEDKGFYRVHLHLDGLRHDFDESVIFAMGGNAQTLVSGLAGGPGSAKSKRIIEQALFRRKDFSVSTVSGTLLPPYPAGFFKHPVLDEPYEYQNGGQWDWFGGKLVLAMFESGFSREAREQLIAIARKDAANGGFFEWDTKEGAGRGSGDFTGSAGSLARALVEGYYGIRMTRDALELSPRLGRDEAKVHFYIPASGRFIAYDYRVDEKNRKLRLEISSDQEPGPAVSVLNPWASLRLEGVSDGSPDMEVLVNGVKVPFRVERVGRDEYIRLDARTTRPKKAVIEVRILPKA